jgi:hypothetical protein
LKLYISDIRLVGSRTEPLGLTELRKLTGLTGLTGLTRLPEQTGQAKLPGLSGLPEQTGQAKLTELTAAATVTLSTSEGTSLRPLCDQLCDICCKC